jgi:carboxyl-terminal processing protease
MRLIRNSQKSNTAFRSLGTCVVLVLGLMLQACGGGGGDAGRPPFASAGAGISPFPPDSGGSGGSGSHSASSAFQGVLLRGTGAAASDWSAASCTLARQRNWVKSNLLEDYLFYREMPAIDANSYAGSPVDLFYDLTTNALPAKDRFSFVITQSDADAAFQAGTAIGTGASYVYDGNGRLRVVYVEASGSASGRISRGAQVVSINQTPVGTAGLTQAQFDALFPAAAGGSVTLGVQNPPGSATQELTLANTQFAINPVNVQTVLPGGRTGYLHYTDFSTPSGEQRLAEAFQAFGAAGVTDLVVDLRYNGGGYLFLSSELGYMVGGSRSTGRTFEQLVYNDKRSAENEVIPFLTTRQLDPGRGQVLPALHLQRVFVLATGDTCSASESFISALRGIDVQVVLIGGTTCGKPYGFSQENNCTMAYFPLEFEGRNHKGEVFPVTGIAPTCNVADDLSRPLGDPTEALLAAALTYRDTGACPAPATGTSQRERASAAGLGSGVLGRSPLRQIKLHR